MRITNNMMINNMNRNLNRNLVNMDQRQNQIATGKRIHRPSDDPIGTTRIMQLKSYIRQLDQNHSAAEDALSWMGTSESVANQYVDALQRARELTVQAANGSLTSSETSKIQEEIKEIREHIIGLGNTSHGGKYIFSGKEIDQPLLNPDGSYNDAVHQKLLDDSGLIDDQIKYAIGMNETLPINITGLELFEDQRTLTDWSETMSLPAAQVGTTANIDSIERIELMGFQIEVETKSVKWDEDGTGTDVKDVIVKSDGKAYEVDVSGVVADEPLTYGDDDKLLTEAQLDIEYSMILKRATDIDDDGNTIYEEVDLASIEDDFRTRLGLEGVEAEFDDTSSKEIFKGLEDIQKIISAFTNPVQVQDEDDTDAIAHNQRLTDLNMIFIKQQMEEVNPGVEFNEENIENFLNRSDQSFMFEGTRIYRLENFNFETTGVSRNNLVDNKENNYQKQIAFSASPKKPGVMQMLDRVEKNLLEGNQEALSEDLGDFDRFLDVALTARSTLGARMNRGTLVRDRIESDRINFREQLSNVEDVDMAETITKLLNEENVYRASLSVGARIVQPTLIDFLR